MECFCYLSLLISIFALMQHYLSLCKKKFRKRAMEFCIAKLAAARLKVKPPLGFSLFSTRLVEFSAVLAKKIYKACAD